MSLKTVTVCLLLLTSFILSSCQTTHKQSSINFRNQNSGVFTGSVYIKDAVKGKSFVVSFKSQLYHYTNMRLDVTAPFIGHLASVTVNNQNLQYMIPRQRLFYSGSINAPDVEKHLPFPVNPKVLSHIFWGTAIKDKSWRCSQDTQVTSACIRPAEKVKITWERQRNLQPSVITVNHPRGLVKFQVKGFTPGLSAQQKQRFVMVRPNW